MTRLLAMRRERARMQLGLKLSAREATLLREQPINPSHPSRVQWSIVLFDNPMVGTVDRGDSDREK